MRLNFSASGEEAIREGIRRIGKVVREQVALYGTLTGRPAPKPTPVRGPRPVEPGHAQVVPLPRRKAQ
jgi:2-aminoadipate transaminase